eukprot:scaffold91019_cov62-Phaeocystis_antarctica.AAC.3
MGAGSAYALSPKEESPCLLGRAKRARIGLPACTHRGLQAFVDGGRAVVGDAHHRVQRDLLRWEMEMRRGDN